MNVTKNNFYTYDNWKKNYNSTKTWLAFVIKDFHATTNLQWFYFQLDCKIFDRNWMDHLMFVARNFSWLRIFQKNCKEFFWWARQTRKMTLCSMSCYDYYFTVCLTAASFLFYLCVQYSVSKLLCSELFPSVPPIFFYLLKLILVRKMKKF